MTDARSTLRTFAILAAVALGGTLGPAPVPAAAADESDPAPGHHRASAGGVDATLAFEPAQPAPDEPAKLTLTLVRGDGGEPIAATDVRIRWSMPKMGHEAGVSRMVPQRSPGRYATTHRFPMPGVYRAVVVVGGGDEAVEIPLELTIGGDAGMDPGSHDGDHSAE